LRVQAADLDDLNDGSRYSVEISHRPVQDAVATVVRSLRAIRQAENPPRPDEARCRGCDYRVLCRHAAGGNAPD
jgi:CRISPR/Cas system-associated exonuclease Cas4 (RecB family)